ncbi:hypothetical protein PISMIDRAFT_689495 [Pisolithus microcarpus 441]|uniref:Uncharacterized protein n=1 Tax=Pisolithus microcarpus 441 TaxID=765257 RepID=A0A0C9XJB4_9AGAM|nr:hypothetical protein PISMIDRAFT_689495 [Pisolithus microcarpus 441]
MSHRRPTRRTSKLEQEKRKHFDPVTFDVSALRPHFNSAHVLHLAPSNCAGSTPIRRQHYYVHM